MNLELSDEQLELRATLRRWAAADAPVAVQARPLLDGATWKADGAWQALVDMGVAGPLDVVDATVVAEELGRVLYPGPWRSTIAGAWLAAAAGADGAVPDGAAAAVVLDGEVVLDGDTVSGTAEHVLGLPQADVALVRAGTTLVAVDVTAADDGHGIDPTSPDATLRLDRTPARVVAELADDAADDVRDRIAIVHAADALGAAQAVLDIAVEHAKVRHQFGQPIGAFQAVAHLCVDLLETVELARSGVLHAAWAADAGTREERRLAVLRLRGFADRLATVGDGAIQVLGGIGYTWEHDAHLHLRRLLRWSATAGPSSSRVELGRAVVSRAGGA